MSNPPEIDLYYLGFCGQVLYLSRFAIQWVASERRKRSVVPLAFWVASVMASAIMIVHYLIQAHLPLSSLQWVGSYIAARNWWLMRGGLPRPLVQHYLWHVLYLVIGWLALVIAYAAFQSGGDLDAITTWRFWISSPNPSSSPPDLSWQMHVFGMTGALFLAARFWIQWALVESGRQTEQLGQYFWILSLIGSTIVLIYSWAMNDWVTAFGPLIGLPMYMRNLTLIAHRRMQTPEF